MRGLATGMLLAAVVGATAAGALAGEWSGNLGLEGRYFPEPPVDPRQHGDNLSLHGEIQYHVTWDGGDQGFTVRPFFRIDRHDDERTHGDLRELEWILSRRDWELRLGIRKVFWGVTEAAHLVDIVNQTDLVENPDGEDKLGQPMVNLALIRDWGTLDLFFMPWFRERTFPGVAGRLRPSPPVDEGRARYEEGAGERSADWALRWSRAIGDWDIGLAYFSGTARDPVFELGWNADAGWVLVPVYHRIDQAGLDVQFSGGDTLWKLEAIRRVGQGQSFVAAAGGFEHTLYGVFDSAADAGLLAEYLYNDQGDRQYLTFENDLFLGLRLMLNDVQDTRLLFGVIKDLDGGALLYNLEASRRLGDNFRLGLEARFFTGLEREDPEWVLRRDDYVQLDLAWYF